MAFFSLLDQPAIRERAVRFSVDQYHLLGEAGLISENVELLEGIVVEKMPKSALHSAVTQRAAKRLRAVLGAEWDIRQEQPITHNNSEPEPDIAVVPTKEDDYASGHPVTAELVIEVAISSSEFDYQKRAIYAAANVREYWIVLPETRTVEVYMQPSMRDYAIRRIFTVPAVAASEIFPAFQLDLGTFFPD